MYVIDQKSVRSTTTLPGFIGTTDMAHATPTADPPLTLALHPSSVGIHVLHPTVIRFHPRLGARHPRGWRGGEPPPTGRLLLPSALTTLQ